MTSPPMPIEVIRREGRGRGWEREGWRKDAIRSGAHFFRLCGQVSFFDRRMFYGNSIPVKSRICASQDTLEP